jgi:hypothetical protein
MRQLNLKRFVTRPVLAGVAAAALALPLLAAAPPAAAADVGWSVTIGSGGHDRGHGGGYYKSVWRPPTYQTRYTSCGRSYQVCIKAGYYDRVWVAAPRRSHYRSNNHYTSRSHYGQRGYERTHHRDRSGWGHSRRGHHRSHGGWYGGGHRKSYGGYSGGNGCSVGY